MRIARLILAALLLATPVYALDLRGGGGLTSGGTACTGGVPFSLLFVDSVGKVNCSDTGLVFDPTLDKLTIGGGITLNAGNFGIGTASPAQSIHSVNGHWRFDQIAAPSAPTAAVNAAAGTLNGTYSYRVTFVTALGETETGTASGTVSPANQQVDLSAIPVGPTGTTARKIYRTTAGGLNTTMQLVTTIADNTTTTYTDNLADGSLGANENRVNTTGSVGWNGSTRVFVADQATTAIGYGSLRINTGYLNSAFGANTLYYNTTGYNNSALSANALFNNTTGHNNSALGVNSLFYNTTGYINSALGVNSLFDNTTGYNNSAFGANSLFYNTTGYNNSALGVDAGRFITDGATSNQTSNTSVYLGAQTKASVDGDTNETVIGYDAIGGGSNSAQLGNTSVTKFGLGAVFLLQNGVLKLGADAASATAQTIKSHDINSGTSNTNAPDMILSSGKSTGTGTGRVVFQAAPAGGSGTAQNTQVDVAYVKPTGVDLASGMTFSLNTVVQKFPKTFTATYDPASLAAGTARCDNVTVTGITTSGGAVTANIGAVDPATGCVMSSVRASAADTVRVCWMNTIDASTACDTASSTWTFTQAQ